MRREIDTVPKDGKSVILEDDARGTYELARWSTEQSAWVGEDGKPIPITPTHWLPLQRGECLLPEGDECLPQREAESCDAPDPRIRHILPLSSGRAALEWPPAQEDDFAHRRDARAAVTFPVIEPRTAASQPGPPAWRRLVVSSIAAAMISSSLICMYFRAQIAAYVTLYAAQHDSARIGTIVEPSKQSIPLPVQELQQADLLGGAPAVQARGKADGSGEQTAAWGVVQTTVSQATEVLEKEPQDAAATAPQSQELDREKTSALLQDLAAARQELTANQVQYRKTLAEERDRSATLASELATAQRNAETQVVRSNKIANEATELKKAADTAASELQRERERAEALASELAKVRREGEAAEAVSSQKDDQAAQLKRKAEAATAELQLSLQQRDKPQALQNELAKVRQNVDAQVATLRKMNEEAERTKQIETVTSPKQAAQDARAELRPSLRQERGQPKGNVPRAEPMRQVAGAAATEESVSTEAKDSEAAGLLARAKALLGQGNIGAARVVLERAAETGSAQAAFALAETYDPNVLATWRTHGTRGDGTKARALYARAYDGGIKAAKDRSDALVVGDGGRKPASWFGREEADIDE